VQVSPKLTRIRIFGLKTRHLATLQHSPNFFVHSFSNISSIQGDQIRMLGDCFLWAAFLKYRRSPNFPNLWATFFPRKKLFIKLNKKRYGLYFGQFFHKVIWSPSAEQSIWVIEHEWNFRANQKFAAYHQIHKKSLIFFKELCAIPGKNICGLFEL
jgi:hypothetical protein